MGAGLAGNCGPGAFSQQERGIIRRQRTRGRARTAPIEALEGLLNLPAINHECSAGSEHRSQPRELQQFVWHISPLDHYCMAAEIKKARPRKAAP